MIDFHSHTFFSDGALSCAEHVRRALVAGYKVLGITDHVDESNIEFIFTSIIKFIDTIKDSGWDIFVIPGVEITHVPARNMDSIVQKARDLKIPLVVVHGESPVEPVEKGTNRAAIESLVDIVAHPGLILPEDVKRAAELGVSLEITGRRGHSLTNGHVAKLAEKYQAKLVLDSDAHSHDDFFKEAARPMILRGCGMSEDEIVRLEANMKNVAEQMRIFRR